MARHARGFHAGAAPRRAARRDEAAAAREGKPGAARAGRVGRCGAHGRGDRPSSRGARGGLAAPARHRGSIGGKRADPRCDRRRPSAPSAPAGRAPAGGLQARPGGVARARDRPASRPQKGSTASGMRRTSRAATRSSWRPGAARRQRSAEERHRLAAERERLAALRSAASRKEAALTEGRAARSSLLARIRGRPRAARAGDSRARSGGPEPRPPRRFVRDDARRSWRSTFESSGGCSTGRRRATVRRASERSSTRSSRPRFRTRGSTSTRRRGRPFRAVFDGRVAYAAALHGYGLTLRRRSRQRRRFGLRACRGALVMRAGDAVSRGQDLGHVGESGSLRGRISISKCGTPESPSIRRHGFAGAERGAPVPSVRVAGAGRSV